MAGRLRLLLLAVFVSVTRAQFSPPQTYDGFFYGQGNVHHPLILETYFDLLCPYCRLAWPALKRLPQVYGEDRLSLIVHPFSAP